jgi:proteasome lid subunit RPN8/RPN11
MSESTIDFSEALRRELEDHCFSTIDVEVGGFLIGESDSGGLHISATIPALSAESGEAHLTITHAVWDEVLTTVEDDYPDQSIVGWYHTHPGFGLFLSPYDLFIHENYFPASHQVALVVDPLAGEQGWFGWASEEVKELSRSRTLREHALRPEPPGARRQHSPWRDPVVIAVMAVSALLFFGVGWLLSSATQASPRSNQLVPSVAPRVITYTARDGDTWSSLSKQFYGIGDCQQVLKTANVKVVQPSAGLDLIIPFDCKGAPA